MMIIIHNYKIFESKSEIESICKIYDIKNYTTNDDMSISVNGYVDLSKKALDKIPLKFKEVSGSFYCSRNSLVSLEGCPEIVGGDFDCGENILNSLKGCPLEINGDFFCDNNNLESLEFSPQQIRNFYCCNNHITNFDGLPELFDTPIDISENPVHEIYKLFEDPKCIYYIKEFDVIQGNKIIKDRLEEVYVHMGLEIPKDIKFSEYLFI